MAVDDDGNCNRVEEGTIFAVPLVQQAVQKSVPGIASQYHLQSGVQNVSGTVHCTARAQADTPIRYASTGQCIASA
eukprot:3941981-Rhodomonas_salina.9